MTSQRKQTWTKKTPAKEGWYWYRDDDRSAVLHVFDPLGNGYWKAWDWDHGPPHALPDEPYEGEWYGPLEEPP